MLEERLLLFEHKTIQTNRLLLAIGCFASKPMYHLKGPAYRCTQSSPIVMILGYFVDLLTLNNEIIFIFNFDHIKIPMVYSYIRNVKHREVVYM